MSRIISGDERCQCGGQIVPETMRGVEHHICTSCQRCDVCDRDDQESDAS